MTDTATETLTVEQAVHIDASAETVWSFWTEPARLAEWWGRATDIEMTAGGTFRVVMNDGHPVMRGEFIELDPPHRLAFTFGWEENEGAPLSAGSTRVEVTLTPADGGTDLVLRHFDMPATHAADHARGWSMMLDDQLPAAIAAAAA